MRMLPTAGCGGRDTVTVESKLRRGLTPISPSSTYSRALQSMQNPSTDTVESVFLSSVELHARFIWFRATQHLDERRLVAKRESVICDSQLPRL